VLQKACLQDERTLRLAALRAELATIGMSENAGGDEHRRLLAEFQALNKRPVDGNRFVLLLIWWCF
jgi:hypothetical protein